MLIRALKLNMKEKNLTDLIENITKESDSLKGHGQLDGLHNIARQNGYLAQIYVELIKTLRSLHRWTIGLTITLIILTIVLVFVGLLPYIHISLLH